MRVPAGRLARRASAAGRRRRRARGRRRRACPLVGALLGRGFTPYPLPSPEGALVERVTFSIVRHPIYAAVFFFFAGFSLATSVPALVLTGALAVLGR